MKICITYAPAILPPDVFPRETPLHKYTLTKMCTLLLFAILWNRENPHLGTGALHGDMWVAQKYYWNKRDGLRITYQV